MIAGIGTDVIEIGRIRRLLSEKFVARILHPDEIEIYESFSHEERRVTFLAGRFAVKEAFAKAYGTGIGKQFNFKDICCLNDEKGKPYIEDQIYHVHVSIAHSHTVATAFVVLENRRENE
ncbi:holo-[acyl-carrier-protein] synthase [Macrococcus hajekii]|uniref:Holo-[acyl-carrier-protein] synthase n=1 Tax=Macrococcus hajekii TaxID=198482 RepID=A0A4R6BHU4_9STAP|nr:holo-ACP synthase [Macrococcus hajekii]TDM01074.1 holo-[acyl-carrier-protein] synthase [Macrococcus hajekii]GGB12606.1 holo-[acyl-carrier-protein] synthase [Macrococcus hajekii]